MFQPWRWKQHVPKNCLYLPTRLCNVTTHKSTIWEEGSKYWAHLIIQESTEFSTLGMICRVQNHVDRVFYSDLFPDRIPFLLLLKPWDIIYKKGMLLYFLKQVVYYTHQPVSKDVKITTWVLPWFAPEISAICTLKLSITLLLLCDKICTMMD